MKKFEFMSLRVPCRSIIFAICFLCLGITVFAGQVPVVDLDNDITVSSTPPVITYNGKEIEHRLLGDATLSGNTSDFSITAPKYSYYKTCLFTRKPGLFSASGKQLLTVVDLKFKVSLKNKDVAYKPTATYGFSYTLDGADDSGAAFKNIFIEGFDSAFEPDGENWINLRCEFNPVKATASVFKDGVKIKEYPIPYLSKRDIKEIRFYPRSIPEKNGDGLYPNGKTSLNFGDDDSAVSMCTPVVFTFDYFKIYNITPYSVESSIPENNGKKFNVSESLGITFDTPMNASTVTGNSIKLNLINVDGSEEGMPVFSSPIRDRSFAIYPSGSLEYFSRYKLSVLPGVKDINGFNNNEVSNLYFTTQKRPVSESVSIADSAAPMTIKCNGQTASILASGEVSGLLKLNNNSSADKKIRVVIGLYTMVEQSNLIVFNDSKSSYITLKQGLNNIETHKVTVPDDSNAYIQVLVWDENGYPFTDPIICKMGSSVYLDD